MDPNATLRDILDRIQAINGDHERQGEISFLAHDLRELSDWLRRGGFPPTLPEAYRPR